MSIATDLSERMSNLPESSAISVRLSINTYFDVIQGLLANFAPNKNLQSIYITSTIPAQPIINALRLLEVNTENIYFIDCVSNVLMSKTKDLNNVYFVESATMLENLILKVEYLLKKLGGGEGGQLVMVDSINSLAIHNNSKILSEFLHILVNNLRAKNVYTVILSLAEQSNEDINNMTSFVCDDTIIIEESEQ
jgi:KaiC/GvpD/RAD55 family RecA-like ATPase